ncbi:hypothetical protein GGX14DRAFT_557016 [Mycena pura]|uniref:AB hydrolase-1 domain-containing protein n=1 Tax=Mycena pura TaxID=153505 RepID=A0AAD6YMM0_9AGAR|nr:hypothetical protein GGX14DRAFT_557016 [Mycena pura]
MSSTANEVEHKEYIIASPLLDPLVVSAKCYKLCSSTTARATPRSRSIVLLLAHGLGFHKEHWEPFLQELSRLLTDFSQDRQTVTEAWALDCQDHGDSAVLNEQALSISHRFVSCYDYGKAFVALLQSPCFLHNKDARIVFVGHSAGAASAILASTYFPTFRDIPFHCWFLIEPAMIRQDLVESDEECTACADLSLPLPLLAWLCSRLHLKAAGHWFGGACAGLSLSLPPLAWLCSALEPARPRFRLPLPHACARLGERAQALLRRSLVCAAALAAFRTPAHLGGALRRLRPRYHPAAILTPAHAFPNVRRPAHAAVTARLPAQPPLSAASFSPPLPVLTLGGVCAGLSSLAWLFSRPRGCAASFSPPAAVCARLA